MTLSNLDLKVDSSNCPSFLIDHLLAPTKVTLIKLEELQVVTKRDLSTTIAINFERIPQASQVKPLL